MYRLKLEVEINSDTLHWLEHMVFTMNADPKAPKRGDGKAWTVPNLASTHIEEAKGTIEDMARNAGKPPKLSVVPITGVDKGLDNNG
jgi:hypothetical protein